MCVVLEKSPLFSFLLFIPIIGSVVFLYLAFNNKEVSVVEDEESKKKRMLENEKNSKKYIEENMNDYSKDALKKQLIDIGLSNNEVDNYLNKYYIDKN